MNLESVTAFSFSPQQKVNPLRRSSTPAPFSGQGPDETNSLGTAASTKEEKDSGTGAGKSEETRQLTPEDFAREAFGFEPFREEAKSLGELTAEERAELRELKAKDALIRTEQISRFGAVSALAQGGLNYHYETGPDGRKYAIEGNLSIDMSKGSNPEESLRKALQLRSAALAGISPSLDDLRMTAISMKMALEASSDIARALPEEPESETRASSTSFGRTA